MKPKVLLIGCGHDHRRKICLGGRPERFDDAELVTLDMDPNCGATVVWDLEQRPLPFGDEEFDELHAYDVLEHIGKQGDWRGYFDEFAEYWRILKPGGLFHIAVPTGEDRFADPGHTRFFAPTWFAFLSKKNAERNRREGTQMTDYSWVWKYDFDVAWMQDQGHHFLIALQKCPI